MGRMMVTEYGIDWGRIRPEDHADLEENVMAYATGCVLHHVIPLKTPSNLLQVHHYKTVDGRTICPESALYHLKNAALKPSGYGGYDVTRDQIVRHALANANAASTWAAVEEVAQVDIFGNVQILEVAVA